MRGVEFEWDEQKAAANLVKHKICFHTAQRVFDDAFALIELDVSEDYGEERFLAKGVIAGRIVTVVFTPRGERTRIISARKANTDERAKYYRSQTR